MEENSTITFFSSSEKQRWQRRDVVRRRRFSRPKLVKTIVRDDTIGHVGDARKSRPDRISRRGNGRCFGCSVEAAPSQIVGYDDVCHGIEYELNVGGICGTSHVTVDFFGCWFVFGFKLCLNISCCFTILLQTFKQ